MTYLFQDPYDKLIGGYDIHCYYDPLTELDIATKVYTEFITFLGKHNIVPTFSHIYYGSDGPHIKPTFAVHLMGINPVRDRTCDTLNDETIRENGITPNQEAIRQLGVAVSWMSLNRQGLRVLIHPNYSQPFGQPLQEKIDHTERGITMSNELPSNNIFDVDFFDILAKMSPDEAMRLARDRHAIPSE
jgi:aromatic ring-cleaving dioxygenase